MTTEYANTRSSSPTTLLMNARIYWKVSAVGLAAVALLGIALNALYAHPAWIIAADFLEFDWTHNIVHVALAGAAFYFGFSNVSARLAQRAAILFGFVYAGLAVVGFVDGEALAFLGLHLELGENVIHLLLGGYALVAGFTAYNT